MQPMVRIGVIGDFNPEFSSHTATNAAIAHAAAAIPASVDVEWIPTPVLGGADTEGVLAPYDGLWASPGSPYLSMEGMLAAIRFARERDRPFIGT